MYSILLHFQEPIKGVSDQLLTGTATKASNENDTDMSLQSHLGTQTITETRESLDTDRSLSSYSLIPR